MSLQEPTKRILITGAFGRLGKVLTEKARSCDWQLVCTDLESATTAQEVEHWRNQGIEVILGDLRNADFIEDLIQNRTSNLDAVIHMAAIVPPMPEIDSKLSYEVNVIATSKLLKALEKLTQPPFFIFTSSYNVYGVPLSNHSVKSASDGVVASDFFGTHKIEAEQLVKDCKLPWSIARLGAVLDANTTSRTSKKLMNIAFEMSPDIPSECIHTDDAVLAIFNLISKQQQANQKILLIGGGLPCRVTHFDLMNVYFQAWGLKIKPAVFGRDRHACHWLDTKESQTLLQYQQHSYKDICQQANHRFKRIRLFVRPFSFILSPIANWYIARFLRKSSWL